MSDISNYLHGQITRKKIEKGLEMLRNESPQELKKRLQNVNIDEAMRKLDEYDKKRLRELGINVSEYRNRIAEADIQKIYQVLGRDGDKVIRKIREILN